MKVSKKQNFFLFFPCFLKFFCKYINDQSQKQLITLVIAQIFRRFINYDVKRKKLKLNYFDAIYKNSNLFPIYMIIYATFERSRRVLTLFIVFDFDQTNICRKISKDKEKTKKSSAGTFRLLVNFGGIFHSPGPELRLLVIPHFK